MQFCGNNTKVAFTHIDIMTLTHIKLNLRLLGFDTISKPVQRLMKAIIPSRHFFASRSSYFQVPQRYHPFKTQWLLYVPLALTLKFCTIVGII
jgi:hypothetical protein